MQTSKKNKNIIGIIQSFLILILVVLIIFMMIQISRLQGTARVINYAGLVRGATQREVKLEITGNQNDELIKYLDDILLGLRYQDGHYDLVKLNDEEYQEKLQIQSDYWDKLKTEIEAVRNKGYENTDIVNMSEIYFTMADETVSAAESYSEKIAIKIRTIELLSALDMLSLVILVIMQTLKAMQMAMQNRLLEQKAFVDAHTGLKWMKLSQCIEETPVIMISSEESVDAMRKAYEMGITDYITRPFDSVIVKKRVQNTLELYANQKRLINVVVDQVYEKEENNNIMLRILSNVLGSRNSESSEHILHIRTATEMMLRQLLKTTDAYHLTETDIAIITTA